MIWTPLLQIKVQTIRLQGLWRNWIAVQVVRNECLEVEPLKKSKNTNSRQRRADLESIISKTVCQKLRFDGEFIEYYDLDRDTNLSVDKLRSKYIRQKEDRLVFRIFLGRSGNIGVNSSNFLPFPWGIENLVGQWYPKRMEEITFRCSFVRSS